MTIRNLCLSLFALGLATPVVAQTLPLGRVPREVTIEVLEQPYDLLGTTAGQLLAGLRAGGRGGRWYSYRWRYEWTYQSKRVDSRSSISGSSRTQCETDRIGIRLLFSASFPRWDPPDEAAPALVDAWTEFTAGIQNAWEQHRNVALAGAREMIQKVDRLEEACPLIFREAQSLVDVILEKYAEEQAEVIRESGRVPWPPAGFQLEPEPPPSAPERVPPSGTSPSPPTSSGVDPNLPQHLPPGVDPSVYAGPPVARDIFGAVRRDVGVAGSTGLVVGLHHEGKLDYLEAFGTPEAGSDVVLLPTDVFAFPALTEVLLGTTIDVLVASGMLDIDAPISTYVSGIDPALSDIRLRQLLTHRAGLDNARVSDSLPWAETLDALNRRAVFTEPGMLYSYSRYSYPLAMRVVEAATGVPFAEVARESILDPLSMDSTTFDPGTARELGLVSSFRWPAKRDFAAEGSSPPTIEALPVSFTTVPDMLKLLTAWVDGDIPGSSPPGSQGSRRFRSGVWADQVEGTARVQRICQAGGFGAGFIMFPETRSVAVLWGVNNWPDGTSRFLLNQLSTELELGPAIFGTGTWGGGATMGEGEVRCAEKSPPRALLSEEAGPVAAGAWPGRYFNGDRALELVDRNGSLVFDSGGTQMELVHFIGAIHFTRLADRPMFPVELLVDEQGRRYVRMTGRAYIHDDDRPRG